MDAHDYENARGVFLLKQRRPETPCPFSKKILLSRTAVLLTSSMGYITHMVLPDHPLWAISPQINPQHIAPPEGGNVFFRTNQELSLPPIKYTPNTTYSASCVSEPHYMVYNPEKQIFSISAEEKQSTCAVAWRTFFCRSRYEICLLFSIFPNSNS